MSASPREPFDAEEARLKRAYDALPHGEPSAALDARILAQARAAAAPHAKRQRPWFLGAGLGTAAAAVFAAGIAWQLGVFEGDRALSTAPVEAPAAQEEELDRIDIEFLKQERKKDEAKAPEPVAPAAPPPPPAAAPAPAAEPPAASPVVLQDESTALETLERRRESTDKPRQQAQPEPFPAEAEEAQAIPGYADGDARAERDGDGETAGARSDVLAEAQSSAADSANTAAADASTDTPEAAPAAAANPPSPLGAAATGAAASRRAAGLAKETTLPPWAEDARLAPAAWLERIRDRVRQGDRQGAEHSLRRFVLEHPRHPVPRDLQRLLVE